MWISEKRATCTNISPVSCRRRIYKWQLSKHSDSVAYLGHYLMLVAVAVVIVAPLPITVVYWFRPKPAPCQESGIPRRCQVRSASEMHENYHLTRLTEKQQLLPGVLWHRTVSWPGDSVAFGIRAKTGAGVRGRRRGVHGGPRRAMACRSRRLPAKSEARFSRDRDGLLIATCMGSDTVSGMPQHATATVMGSARAPSLRLEAVVDPDSNAQVLN